MVTINLIILSTKLALLSLMSFEIYRSILQVAFFFYYIYLWVFGSTYGTWSTNISHGRICLTLWHLVVKETCRILNLNSHHRLNLWSLSPFSRSYPWPLGQPIMVVEINSNSRWEKDIHKIPTYNLMLKSSNLKLEKEREEKNILRESEKIGEREGKG